MGYLDISIKYGSETINHFLPDDRGILKVIDSPEVKSSLGDLSMDFIHALENPLQSPSLQEMITRYYPGSNKKIILIADDNTRPNLHSRILFPLLLDYLINTCGVRKEDLGILIASGTHRPPTDQEIIDKILGERVFQDYQEQIMIHNDQENLIDLGLSSSGTPITINKDAINACLLIPVTDSEYHYFAGVAGTVKQLFPGIAGRITTNTNHTRMFDKELGFKPVCRLGNTQGNPVITDIKEMAQIVGEHAPVFCIDAIIDQGEITQINAGDILTLHELAVELLFDRRVIHVDRPADLVIISPGEISINLYQSGKAIQAAWNGVKKPGGTILLISPCPDGVGADGYEKSMRAIQGMDVDQALEWIIDNKCGQDSFQIGNQKPVDTLRMLKSLGTGRIKILSEMDPVELKDVYRLDPLPDRGSLQESLRDFLDKFLDAKPDALIYLMRNTGLYVVPGENGEG